MEHAEVPNDRSRRISNWLGWVSAGILIALVLAIVGVIGTIVITHQRAMWGCSDAPTALVADLEACLEPGYTLHETYLVTNKEKPGVTYIGAVLSPLPGGWPFGAAVWATNVEVHVDDLPRAGQLVPLDTFAVDATSSERTIRTFVREPDTPRLVASMEDAGARKAKECADEQAGWAQSPVALIPGGILLTLWRELQQRRTGTLPGTQRRVAFRPLLVPGRRRSIRRSGPRLTA